MSTENQEIVIIPAIRHSFGYLTADNLVEWAWKGAAKNTDPAVIQTFKMIAEQFEKVRDS